MSRAENCWVNLIIRYGQPLSFDSLDEDTLELAIAERRALRVHNTSDGFGSGDMYFRRAQMGDPISDKDEWGALIFCVAFSHPCELTDEEVTALDCNPWERWADVSRSEEAGLHEHCVSLALSVINLVFSNIHTIQGNRCQFLIFSTLLTHELKSLPILAELACWRNLIIRCGSPLYKDSLDENILKQAIAERRALRVYDDYYLHFCRAQTNDVIKGIDREKKPYGAPYFCIVFPRSGEIIDEEAEILSRNRSVWWRWSEACKYTDWILATECWKSLITRYRPPLEPESLDEDILEQAIAERRALKVIEQHRWDHGDRVYKPEKMYFLRAEVGDTITGTYSIVNQPYFCIAFPRPCEITAEEVRILSQVPFGQWEGICEFTDAILRETRNLP